jgi:F-type H+-transporting ATPase subunit gamma
MDKTARIEARIASLKELKELFSAIQAMAASRLQAASSALVAAHEYCGVIEAAIADTVRMNDNHRARAELDWETPSDRAVVVFCAEHGFAGAYNRRLLARAKQAAGPADKVVIVGRRGRIAAPEFGLQASASVSMPTHVETLLPAARRLAAELAPFASIDVVFGRYRTGSQFEIEVRQVLPLNPELLRRRDEGNDPLHHLPSAALLHRLIGEFMLGELTMILIEATASENAARLQIMSAATQNIDDKLDVLSKQSHRLRQELITSELLEIVAGADAITAAGE